MLLILIFVKSTLFLCCRTFLEINESLGISIITAVRLFNVKERP